MIHMTHPQHGEMDCYLDAEVESNKKNGWVVAVPRETITEAIPTSELTEEEKLFAAYEAKFGKPPHHRAKIETIKKALED